ncbi:MAG TPA: hypothetical protein VFC44_08720, partial [Candidatus Saccharimonadales bacterium]|nr:hypothetical protein [Candidatus Saccharimonadales bacterium]
AQVVRAYLLILRTPKLLAEVETRAVEVAVAALVVMPAEMQFLHHIPVGNLEAGALAMPQGLLVVEAVQVVVFCQQIICTLHIHGVLQTHQIQVQMALF